MDAAGEEEAASSPTGGSQLSADLGDHLLSPPPPQPHPPGSCPGSCVCWSGVKGQGRTSQPRLLALLRRLLLLLVWCETHGHMFVPLSAASS